MGELLSPGPYSGLGEQAPTPATLRKANQRRGLGCLILKLPLRGESFVKQATNLPPFFFPRRCFKEVGNKGTFSIQCLQIISTLLFLTHRTTTPRARPPSRRVEWKRLKHSSREALQKNTAQRSCLRECRDDRISTHIGCIGTEC